jgi:hypothetical protein
MDINKMMNMVKDEEKNGEKIMVKEDGSIECKKDNGEKE